MRFPCIIIYFFLAAPCLCGFINNFFDKISNVTSDAAKYAYTMPISLHSLIEVKIIKYLLILRKSLSNGIETFGIPPMEPFQSRLFALNVSHEIGNYNITVEHFHLYNLSTFEIKNIMFSITGFKLNLTVTIAELFMNGIYKLEGDYDKIIKVHGNGPFWIQIHNTSVNAIVKLKVRDQILIDKLTYNVDYGSLDCNIKNLFNDNEISTLLNQMFMEIGKDCLPELWPDIEPETAAIFKKIANVQLRKLFLTDLFQLLHWIVN